MPALESKMVKLGTSASVFTLLNTVTNTNESLDSLKSNKATVIFFICNHCPFVHHINDALVKVANDFIPKGISFIAISSNDVENYPDDSPELMTKVAKQEKYPFPYLYDEDQSVAKAYNAECTPDFFIYDKDLKLVYRGRFDETRPNMGASTGSDLSAALSEIIETGSCSAVQLPSIGCSIKWKN